MSYLLDTGCAVALINRTDAHHDEVSRVMGRARPPIFFPVPAITETAYLLARDAGALAAADFIATLPTTDLILEIPLPADYQRAAEVMRTYADAKLDFVDAIIVAIAERLNITRLLTLDQRDFRMIRPRHCVAFD